MRSYPQYARQLSWHQTISTRFPAMLNETNKATWLKDYRPPLYWIDTTHLDVELGEAGTLVTSRLQLRANHDHANHPQPLELDGRELELISVHVDGRRLESDEYSVNPEGMVLPQAPERFTLEIRTRIHPESNTSLEGLYRSSGNFCTQCEAQGFRKITYYLDRPDVMARFTTRIVAERARYPVLLSNGNPVQEEDLGDGRHAVLAVQLGAVGDRARQRLELQRQHHLRQNTLENGRICPRFHTRIQ